MDANELLNSTVLDLLIMLTEQGKDSMEATLSKEGLKSLVLSFSFKEVADDSEV